MPLLPTLEGYAARGLALTIVQFVALVSGLPLAVLLGHLPPGRARARHPQDTSQYSAVLVVRVSCGGFRGMRGSTISHSSSPSGAPSGQSTMLFGFSTSPWGGPSSRPRVRLATRLTFRQRAATAWCARLHADHPRRKRLRSVGSPIASINRRTSGTVGGIRLACRSPFYDGPPPRGRRRGG